jgi:hypothetical protein
MTDFGVKALNLKGGYNIKANIQRIKYGVKALNLKGESQVVSITHNLKST